jgi:hypothetical protein
VDRAATVAAVNGCDSAAGAGAVAGAGTEAGAVVVGVEAGDLAEVDAGLAPSLLFSEPPF